MFRFGQKVGHSETEALQARIYELIKVPSAVRCTNFWILFSTCVYVLQLFSQWHRENFHPSLRFLWMSKKTAGCQSPPLPWIFFRTVFHYFLLAVFCVCLHEVFSTMHPLVAPFFFLVLRLSPVFPQFSWSHSLSFPHKNKWNVNTARVLIRLQQISIVQESELSRHLVRLKSVWFMIGMQLDGIRNHTAKPG